MMENLVLGLQLMHHKCKLLHQPQHLRMILVLLVHVAAVDVAIDKSSS